MARIVMNSLIQKGKVIRGWLGVSIQAITPELATQFQLEKDYGTLISDVVKDSPAEKAGLLRGDVIFEFGGKQVDEPYMLRNIVASSFPEETIGLKVIRDGEIVELSVTIGTLPSETEKTPTIFKNVLKGISVQNLTPDAYRQLNLPDRIRGVIVTDIEADSPSATSLIPGDIILEINRKAISNIEDYESIVSKIKPDQDVLLLVFRKGSTMFVPIKKE
jgi:serine protease Do